MDKKLIKDVAERFAQKCIVKHSMWSIKGLCVVHDRETYGDECADRQTSINALESALSFMWLSGYGEGMKLAIK